MLSALRTRHVRMPTGFSIGVAAQQKAPVNPVAQEMVDFHKRIDAYMKVRDQATKDLPDVKETGDPAKISAREKALGQAIAKTRTSAKPGDVFGEEMSVYLKKALAEELPTGIKLSVNQVYPTTLPLVSVPAKLLARLPMLPEALEYRLIDHYFLLRDRDANVIVDVLSNVYPTRDR